MNAAYIDESIKNRTDSKGIRPDEKTVQNGTGLRRLVCRDADDRLMLRVRNAVDVRERAGEVAAAPA